MYKEVINFWFNELSSNDGFSSNINIDQIIIKRFGKLHKQAVQGEFFRKAL